MYINEDDLDDASARSRRRASFASKLGKAMSVLLSLSVVCALLVGIVHVTRWDASPAPAFGNNNSRDSDDNEIYPMESHVKVASEGLEQLLHAAPAPSSASASSSRRSARRSPILAFQTAQDTDDRISRIDDIKWGKQAYAHVNITVDVRKKYQKIVGFGGAVTEAATITMSQLNDDLVEQILQAYYGPKGHHYTILRVPIHSCDFSPKSYTFADTPDDFDLKSFDHNVTHDLATQIPFIQRALKTHHRTQRRKPSHHQQHEMKMFASPWSPPAWMKTNNQMNGSDRPCLKPDPRYHQAWARYLSYWFSAYKKHGLDFWGMTVQNEPEYAAPWEACLYTPEEQADFIKNHLGPQMKKDHPDLKIMIYDHNKDNIITWTNMILTDKQAAQYVWGTAFHWYSGDAFDHLTTVHQAFPDKHLLASEACNCPGVIIDSWSRGEAYGHDILGDLAHFAEGWTDWNIVLNREGGPNHLNNLCDAPIIADTTAQTIHFQPTYYFLGHFSRFLPPGAVRVDVKVAGNPMMEVVAFEVEKPASKKGDEDGKQLVMVLLNRSDDWSDFKLDLAHDHERKRDQQAAFVALRPHSILTLVMDL